MPATPALGSQKKEELLSQGQPERMHGELLLQSTTLSQKQQQIFKKQFVSIPCVEVEPVGVSRKSLHVLETVGVTQIHC